MKPLFWKELRQNLKWAIGILAVMGVATIYIAWLVSRPQGGQGLFNLFRWSPYLIPWERFQELSVLGCPLAGLLLGVLHVAAEKRRDLWAFLVHRPVSRTTIFLAKASAGLLLYVVAVGIPVAGGMVWLATPGHAAAPFYLPMTLPGLADVLTGAVYYLAGLLITMREARWYGSRVMAVGVAVVCSLLVAGVPHFWMALIAIFVAASLLGVAAWGSFLGGGQYEPQPVPAKAALGASLFTGVAIVFVVGGGILSATAGLAAYTGVSYQLTPDGEVVRLVQDRWAQVIEITDLGGKRNEPLEREAREANSVYSFFPRLLDVYVFDRSERDSMRARGYRQTGRFYQVVGSDGPTKWMYSFRERLVLAFDMERKVLVGRLGPDGFEASGDPPQRRFGPDLVSVSWANGVLTFTDIVYKLNIHERVVEELIAPAGERVLGVGDLRAILYDAFVVVTEQAIRFLSLDGDALFTTDVEHDTARYGHLRFMVTDEPPRFYVWYAPSFWLGAEALEIPSHLIVYGPDGDAMTRHSLPPIPRPSVGPTWRDAVTSLVVPFGFMVAAFVISSVQGEQLFGPEGSAPAYVIVLNPLVAVACLVVTIGLARRYAFSRGRRWGWGVFNLLVGPAGLGLLWALRDWPARLPCAGCGKKRVVERDRCEHCSVAFPAPARDGTEIFE